MLPRGIKATLLINGNNMTTNNKLTYAQEFARKGGLARAKKLSKKRRIEIAKKAVAAREAKKLIKWT